jgi:hypothetical protein
MSADEERRLTREHLLAVSLGKTTKSHGNENHRTILSYLHGVRFNVSWDDIRGVVDGSCRKYDLLDTVQDDDRRRAIMALPDDDEIPM